MSFVESSTRVRSRGAQAAATAAAAIDLRDGTGRRRAAAENRDRGVPPSRRQQRPARNLDSGVGGARSRRTDPDVRSAAPRARHRREMVRQSGPCGEFSAHRLQHHRRRGHRLRRRGALRRGRADQLDMEKDF